MQMASFVSFLTATLPWWGRGATLYLGDKSRGGDDACSNYTGTVLTLKWWNKFVTSFMSCELQVLFHCQFQLHDFSIVHLLQYVIDGL